MAMFTAVSGIRANQTKLNVISNNIANVNTVSFKSSAANFATVFTTTITGGTTPNGTLGGTNPMQQGNGAMVAEIASNWGSGGAQYTGKNTDLMLNGNGFFAVERINNSITAAATGYYLTRAGNFSLDNSGNLTTTSGNKVYGTSQLEGSAAVTLGRINIPESLNVVKSVDANGNIYGVHLGATSTVPADYSITPAETAAGATSQTLTTIKLSSFSIGSDGSITALYDNGDSISVRADQTTQAAALAAGNPALARTQLVYHTGHDVFAANNTQAGDKGLLSQLAGAKAAFDGGVTVQPAGYNPMEGMQMQLQTATVTNTEGLLYDGNNNYLPGANSGTTDFGVANTGGRGSVSAGALESSNVDLAGEFTNMVIAQRGLEAASKVVKTESDVMQTIIQMV